MLKLKKNGELIIISGTTCAGKGTVINKLLERNKNLTLSVSMTSRPMRDGEVDGDKYKFVTAEEFERLIGEDEFLEYAKVHTNYYGTPKSEIKKLLATGKDVILEINVDGAKQIKARYPETILIFIMATSMEEVKRRIIARGLDSPEQVIERFKSAYQEINEIPAYNYVVVNDEVDTAVSKVEAILQASKCRVDRIEEVSVESEEEIIHEFLVDKGFDNTPFNIE